MMAAEGRISDEQLRKELLDFGEKNVGAVTDSTRPIYLKKLNHLRARENQRSSTRNVKKSTPAVGKKPPLLGFSSDESDNERSETAAAGPSNTGRTRRGATTGARNATAKQTTKSTGKLSLAKKTSKEDSPPPRSLTRPSLRRRSQNASSVVAPLETSTSSVSRRNPRRSARSAAPQAEDNHDSSYRSTKLSDSIGLQTSLAEESQDSGDDYNFEIPDSLADSDSDLDVSKVPDFGSVNSPQFINRSINTSFPMDSTFASQNSEYDGTSDLDFSRANSYLGGSSPMASQNSVSSSRPSSYSFRGRQPAKSNSSAHKSSSKTYPSGSFGESSSWRSSVAHHVSRFLVILLVLFFVSIGIMYWTMRSAATDQADQSSAVVQVSGSCKSDHSEDCIEDEHVKRAMDVIKQLGPLLDDRAAQVECGYSQRSKQISVKEAATLTESSPEFLQEVVLKLIEKNEQWQIILLDADGRDADYATATHLQSTYLNLPLFCRLSRALSKVFDFVLFLVGVALCISVLFALLKWRWQSQEDETRKVYELVEKIIDILKSHSDACQENTELRPYMAIPHVRDMIIPPKERKKKQHLWDKAVKFLSANESRVHIEIKTIDGEDYTVWKWLQTCPNGSKVWQGQAFRENKDGGGLNSPRYSPSPCLKIRNMFDLDVEYGDDWHVYIQDALLEKCGAGHGILHIAVDKTSKEGCVYVKCINEKAAGRAFKSLHGWWFDGNLVTVKYLRLERYHERFPDAIGSREFLQPSNPDKKSLSQQSFYQSVMEAS